MALPSKVKPGDPIKAVDWNALIDFVRAAQVNPGSGVRVTRTPSGTTLAVDKTPPRNNVTLPRHPFQVISVSSGDPNSGDGPTIGVISDSHVINAADKDSYEEDNSDWGLLSDDETEGAFDLPDVGDKIWLQFTFDQDRNLTSIDLMHGPVGNDDWDEYPDPISINTDGDPYQEYYHQIIAEATDPDNDPRDGITLVAADGTKVKIVQILKTNLMLVPAVTTQDADEPGLKIMVALPCNSPATSDDGTGDPISDQQNVKTPWEFASSEETFPFQVKIRTNPDDPGSFDFGVVYESMLLASPDHEDNVEIDGLIDGEDGWVTWGGEDDLVWLEIEWDDWPDSYTASIKSYSNGDDWGDGEIESDGDDPPTQTFARVVLAAITADDQGNPVVDQRVRTHLQMVGAMAADGGGVTLDCIVPAAFPAADALPEWMQGDGNFDDGYNVWFGDGNSSFVGEQAAPISKFEMEVQDPQDDSASSLTVVVGDDDGETNDMLCLTYGSEDSQNQVLCQWVEYPKIELSNDQDAGLGLYVEDTNPTLILADVWDDQDSGNQINLNLETGPELFLKDDSGNEITVNINDYPIVELDDSEDHTGNQINMNLENGPELYLQDGSGNELSVNINDGPEVLLTDDSGNTMDVMPDAITRTLDGDSKDALFIEDGTSEGDLIYWDGQEWAVAELDASDGDILVYSGGSWIALGVGDDGAILVVSNGQPSWLGPGSDGDVLRYGGDGPYWDTPADCGN